MYVYETKTSSYLRVQSYGENANGQNLFNELAVLFSEVQKAGVKFGYSADLAYLCRRYEDMYFLFCQPAVRPRFLPTDEGIGAVGRPREPHHRLRRCEPGADGVCGKGHQGGRRAHHRHSAANSGTLRSPE